VDRGEQRRGETFKEFPEHAGGMRDGDLSLSWHGLAAVIRPPGHAVRRRAR
jgi:hypothetical protein